MQPTSKRAVMSNNPSDFAEIFRAIGALGAKMDALEQRYVDADRRHADFERASTEERTQIKTVLQDLSHRQQSVESTIVRLETTFERQQKELKEWSEEVDKRLGAVEASSKGHSEEIGRMKPTVDLVGRWQQRGIGIGAALSAIGLVAGAALATFRDNLIRMFFPGS